MTRNPEERLYFIARSCLMGLIGGLIFPTAALILGSINFIQTIIIGFFVLVVALIISRLFEKYIDKATRKILKYLNKYKKFKAFILKYF